MFTDTHCHIYSEYYDNIDEVVNSSINNKVNKFINNAVNIETMREVLDLSNKYSDMYCALGIHPEDVDSYKVEDLEFIREHIKDNKVIAIGEIGLDYHYTKENKEKQIELFEAQLKLAEEFNVPVVIHSREATQDTIDTLKKYNVKGVIHSFSGSYEVAQIYIKMGFLLGVNGVITFKNANIKDVYEKIDVSNIILETDSPYLTPVPFRGQKNSPLHIYDIALFMSDLYGISIDELSQITNANIKRIFDI